jgi:hypothetical protein
MSKGEERIRQAPRQGSRREAEARGQGQKKNLSREQLKLISGGEASFKAAEQNVKAGG